MSRAALRWSIGLFALLLVGLLAPTSGAGAPGSPVEVPEPSETALRYYRSGNWLYLANLAWTFVVPALLLGSGLAARLRDRVAALARNRPWRTAVFFVLAYVLITFTLGMPLAWYSGYARPHAYGLSTQSLGAWLSEEVIALILLMGLAALIVPGPLAFIRRSPKHWWVWASIVAIPLTFVLAMVTPIFIAPLFDDFGPMQDPLLETEILALAERAGIEGSRVFEVEKSVDTNTVNAYVTGLGATKRIVLWDTLIARLDREQVLVVMGHEMGHYVLGHVRNSMIAVAAGIVALLLCFDRLGRWFIGRHGARLGLTGLADPAALPLFFLLIALLGLIVGPVANAWSRHQEHEADRFALELTHDNRACAEAFVRLQASNLANPRPGPLFVLFRASHPPLGQRIDFCNAYRPWAQGEPEVYGHHFR